MERQTLNDFIDAKLKEANKLVDLRALPPPIRQSVMEEPSDRPDKAIAITSEILQRAGLAGHPQASRMGLAVLAGSAYPASQWKAAKDFIADTEKLCRESGCYFEYIKLDGGRQQLPPPASDWNYST